ncbi:hypothetical protein 10P302A_gene0004 [Pseudomonas phage 10P302A]|uniref:Uncharacterized protein n=1 Tax=Pseudomonas phage 10P302A TaxID=3038233 RepID=A0AAF0GLY1_9CAUD|nr:hypothetical protein 10P302A_gene0004 [Pseudomonas phage 10P302A]
MNEFRKALLLVIIENLKADGVKFGQDPHTLSSSQSNTLYEWSQAIRYKPSKSASLSQGRQFYVFLSKLEA